MESKELVSLQDYQACDEQVFTVEAKPLQTDLTEFFRGRNRVPGQLIRNPDWLPNGWVTELRTRKSGSSAGHTDKYYFEPGNGGRFRSKAEVMRYLQTGSKDKPKSISNAQEKSDQSASSFIADKSNGQTKSDPPACGCSKPVYYFRPVVCESPLYAEHPGLYPVVYFPVIGSSKNRFKYPPANFLQNLGDLKPIFPQPSNAASSPSCKYDLLRESFSPQNRHSKVNAGHKLSENVPEEPATKKKKPMLVCGLTAPNAGEFHRPSSAHQVSQPHQNSYPVSNTTAPNSLDLSCNISSFTLTTPAGVFSAHLQYRPTSVTEQHHNKAPITSQSQNQTIPVRPMRGQLSPAQISMYNQSQKSSTCTALVPWKPSYFFPQ